MTLRLGVHLFIVWLVHLIILQSAHAQPFLLPEGQLKQKLSFDLVHNLMIIPVTLNGEGPYNFILDSGVGPIIITDSAMVDSLYASDLALFKIRGRGIGDEIEAYVINHMFPSIGDAKTNGLSLVLLRNDPFQLSSYVGMPIHGIIGSDVFRSFSVKINYNRERITLYPPDAKVKKRGRRIPLKIINNKPFLDVTLSNEGHEKNLLLLLDSGAGHAVSLEQKEENRDLVPDRTIEANLGIGLNGPIHGLIGRLSKVEIAEYELEDVVTAYPSPEFELLKQLLGDRNGSIGGELLKRFHLFIDYANEEIYLKRNRKFNDPFEHNMTGMELYVTINQGERRFFVGRIEMNSPASRAGMQVGDELLSINLKNMDKYSLEDINQLMHRSTRDQIIVELLRDGEIYFKFLDLERRI
ncbi:aspartyl protease family protein [Albibacterium profundi]|uniref:Aspartyl protease family protein n=1 Tax=Albibacterium profundi TaxID=3134906 RepID=A0ABV5CFS7_9SPHI